MKKILLIIFTILIYSNNFSQEHKSIHELDREAHKHLLLEKSARENVSAEIVPLNKNVTKNLSKSVFGYLPYWEYANRADESFNFDLLTHIALFDFQASSTGAISEPVNPAWPWTDLINKAHNSGTKIIMVITNFDGNSIHSIITGPTPRWIFMNRVKSLIKENSFDGVNIDFESLNTADRGDLIIEFMQELSDTVHNISPDLEVSYAAPAVNWGGWNFNGLAQSCDYLFVMGYDFYGSWSSTTGPTAPLSGGTYNVSNTINTQYGTLSTFYPEKLILGVPYFGPHWETANTNEGSAINKFVTSVRFKDAQPFSETYGIKWSTFFKNSWYTYSTGSTVNQVWYDDSSSMSLKYDLAISKKLKGVGMWALGYDGARKELWNLLEEKFVIPVGVEEEKNVPTDFALEQNYPNPFNPTTTIKYSIAANTKENFQIVQLNVYDVIGEKVAILVNEIKSSGNYEVNFDASRLTSGIYFYRLSYGNNSLSRKMLLIK
ncbi:MAG: T9SS type A sorting domain-containing protein [Ignavibacteriae bacterium]|nr:T9SS type A sorting domain-containing protein [Ignavibacteriota bacterium]